ncbi:MAG: Fic family protein [Nitrospirae bacterium]|nr:Fic family protein [Nitrospirota bacterium]
MMTFRLLAKGMDSVPTATAWYLAELGESRGRQELFTRQSPQRLKVLREHALIESAISSNRIEGVVVDQKRIRTLVLGRPVLRDRNEEEVHGYREALKLIHEKGSRLPVTEKAVRELHRLARGRIWDAGKYKEKDSDIIEKYPGGRIRVRFKTVPAGKTPASTRDLVNAWGSAMRDRAVHPLIVLAAFNLDFLCIHPFRDGNGRVSRLLLLLQCYHLGYEVGRYISLERLIEQNKDRYYETLEQSSHGWHEGKHDPWPFANYLLYTLKTAYKEFEERVGNIKAPRGAKTALIEDAIRGFDTDFSLTDLERACPGVSRDMIRHVLRALQKSGGVACLGRGPGTRWTRRGITLKRG